MVYYILKKKVRIYREEAMEKYSHEAIELAAKKMEKSKQIFINDLAHVRAGGV